MFCFSVHHADDSQYVHRRQALPEAEPPVRVISRPASKPKGAIGRAHKVIDLDSDDDVPQILPPKRQEVINLTDR